MPARIQRNAEQALEREGEVRPIISDLQGRNRIEYKTYKVLKGQVLSRYLRKDLRNTALSLRPLTEGDWTSIHALRVRVVEAKDGEGLGELGKRTGNRWTVVYTALINDLAADRPLKAGQLVKIARQEDVRYRRILMIQPCGDRVP